MKHIVLNCANIGCTSGENVLKRTKPGQNKFDWKGVEDAYQYYEGSSDVCQQFCSFWYVRRSQPDLACRITPL